MTSVTYVCKCFPIFLVLSKGKQIKICEVIDDAHLGAYFFGISSRVKVGFGLSNWHEQAT